MFYIGGHIAIKTIDEIYDAVKLIENAEGNLTWGFIFGFVW